MRTGRTFELAASLAAALLVGCSALLDLDGLEGTGDGVDASKDAGSVREESGPDDGGRDTGTRRAFSDSFDRADGPIGNGWIEKLPGRFTTVAERLSVNLIDATYRDSLVYRPESENLADVEVAVDITVAAFTSKLFPQVHARVQTGTVGQNNTLDSYVLYYDSSKSAALLGRARGTGSVFPLATFALSSVPQPSEPFRLRLRVKGAAPVTLEAFVERVRDSAVLGAQTYSDEAPDRIDTAGSVGISDNQSSGYTLDNFSRTQP